VAVIEVMVCQSKPGAVFSAHTVQSPEDQALLMTWPGGGQRQVAHALLVEALRREAVVGLLIRMTKDPQYLEGLTQLTAEQLDAEMNLLARAMLETAGKTSHTLAKDIIREAVAGFQAVRSDEPA
jgi:hypothetical protein